MTGTYKYGEFEMCPECRHDIPILQTGVMMHNLFAAINADLGYIFWAKKMKLKMAVQSHLPDAP